MAKRILTALICLPVAVLLVRSGGTPFFFGVLFLAAVALHELNNMAKNKGTGLYLLVCGPAVFMLCLAAQSGGEFLFFPLTIVSLLAVLFCGLWYHKEENCFGKVLFSWFAIGYAGFFFSQLLCLRNFKAELILDTPLGAMTFGETALWLALIGTWSSDSFAYFVGVLFGRRKVCPAISPNKSWEGVVGGVVGCILSVWLLGRQVFWLQFTEGTPANGFFSVYGNTGLILLGILIACFAPLGDLVESQLKRFYAVKDSGGLFPGHGGVLDRFDSILFVVPAVYIYLYLTTGV